MASTSGSSRKSHVPPFVQPWNRMVRSFAGRRFYALLRHRGRKSGKPYETPVMAWRTSGGLLVPISWGTESDWFRNTMAAGECAVQVSGRWYRAGEPNLIERPAALSYLPPATRTMARLFPVPQFLLLRSVEPHG